MWVTQNWQFTATIGSFHQLTKVFIIFNYQNLGERDTVGILPYSRTSHFAHIPRPHLRLVFLCFQRTFSLSPTLLNLSAVTDVPLQGTIKLSLLHETFESALTRNLKELQACWTLCTRGKYLRELVHFKELAWQQPSDLNTCFPAAWTTTQRPEHMFSSCLNNSPVTWTQVFRLP